MPEDIVNNWKDGETDPNNPAGETELSDEELGGVAGGVVAATEHLWTYGCNCDGRTKASKTKCVAGDCPPSPEGFL